jgi:sirohydrochlorin ferrochelatase
VSLSDKDIEEIISELNINDIYYMLYIASKWFERMKKAEHMLRRIVTQLGIYRYSTGGEDIIKAFIREELARALGRTPQEAEAIQLEETPETREKLKKVLEMIKRKERGEDKGSEDKKQEQAT